MAEMRKVMQWRQIAAAKEGNFELADQRLRMLEASFSRSTPLTNWFC